MTRTYSMINQKKKIMDALKENKYVDKQLNKPGNVIITTKETVNKDDLESKVDHVNNISPVGLDKEIVTSPFSSDDVNANFNNMLKYKLEMDFYTDQTIKALKIQNNVVIAKCYKFAGGLKKVLTGNEPEQYDYMDLYKKHLASAFQFSKELNGLLNKGKDESKLLQSKRSVSTDKMIYEKEFLEKIAPDVTKRKMMLEDSFNSLEAYESDSVEGLLLLKEHFSLEDNVRTVMRKKNTLDLQLKHHLQETGYFSMVIDSVEEVNEYLFAINQKTALLIKTLDSTFPAIKTLQEHGEASNLLIGNLENIAGYQMQIHQTLDNMFGRVDYFNNPDNPLNSIFTKNINSLSGYIKSFSTARREFYDKFIYSGD